MQGQSSRVPHVVPVPSLSSALCAAHVAYSVCMLYWLALGLVVHTACRTGTGPVLPTVHELDLALHAAPGIWGMGCT